MRMWTLVAATGCEVTGDRKLGAHVGTARWMAQRHREPRSRRTLGAPRLPWHMECCKTAVLFERDTRTASGHHTGTKRVRLQQGEWRGRTKSAATGFRWWDSGWSFFPFSMLLNLFQIIDSECGLFS